MSTYDRTSISGALIKCLCIADGSVASNPGLACRGQHHSDAGVGARTEPGLRHGPGFPAADRGRPSRLQHRAATALAQHSASFTGLTQH